MPEPVIVPDVSHVITYNSKGGSPFTRSAIKNPRSKLRHKIDLTQTSAAKKIRTKRSANFKDENITSLIGPDPAMRRFLEHPDSPEDNNYEDSEIPVKKTKAQQAEEKNLEFSEKFDD